ncbi:MAG: hypothetical protein ABIR57_08380, partial [Aeromicrobium sp.]
MARQQKLFISRARAAIVAIALATGGLTAVTTQSASAVAPVDTQLVVTDVADATTLNNLSAVSLLTYNISGSTSFAAPVPLPRLDAAPVNAFTLSGNTPGNGALSRSTDGNYLSIAGYHHAPGATGFTGSEVDPKATTAAHINRMVARISATGTVDTSTLLSSPTLSANHPREALSTDGSNFYVTGNNGNDTTAKSGVVLVTRTTGTKVPIAPFAVTSPVTAQPNV